MDGVTLQRYAELVVGFAANVQRDQIVSIGADIGHEEIARILAAEAYSQGARFVDVSYFDPFVKRARVAHARDETLDFIPSWYRERILELGRQRCARISLAGPTAPGVLDGLDHGRAGRDQLPFVPEVMKILQDRTTNWTVVPAPTPAWAGLVHPDLDEAAALERLWEEIVHVCRLDEADPVAAWRSRAAALETTGARLTERRFDAVHFEGPGTDLTVGLLPSSRWLAAWETTVDGIVHLANLPTEEVFTTPDPRRAEGHVRSTKPLVLDDGLIIRGLEVRFEAGRAVEIDADEGGAALSARAARDDGGTRLGEVALVDRESRIGGLGTVFYDTLLDENAVSHVALGDGLDDAVCEEDQPRVNRSGIHIDFMIGGDDVTVTGVTSGGERLPVLVGGTWQV